MDINYNDLFYPAECDTEKYKRKEWPNKTLNSIKKVLKRREILKLNLIEDILK